jgi:hypothetical protein
MYGGQLCHVCLQEALKQAVRRGFSSWLQDRLGESQVGIQIAGKRLVGNNRDSDPRFEKQVDAELLRGYI